MSESKSDKNKSPQSMHLPLMPLREVVVFPYSIMPLFVGRGSSIHAIEAASSGYDKRIMLVAQRQPEQDKPGPDELYSIGTIAKILQVLRLPDGTIKVLFEGVQRARCIESELVQLPRQEGDNEDNEYYIVKVEPITDVDKSTIEAEATIQATVESLEEYSKLNKKIPPDSLNTISGVNTPGRMADLVASYLKADYKTKQDLLEILDTQERLIKVYEIIQNEIAVANIERTIKNRVKGQMERNQREYYLNEQIKAIHKEMGREDDQQAELQELEIILKEKDMPEEARAKGLSELKKLRVMPPSSAEYTVVRNYLDWIIDLPWNKLQETNLDIKKAREILDADHYGLEKPKERIMEYLAVQKLAHKLKGPILCLVGPPGVGKTSLAKSVARATGREFVRLSLGGVRDEAEIRGHRRTYVGALPGKILQSLKRAKYNNPLFCLDEIDKMTADFRGDPSSALLEVLDPEQNNTFNDHYLDLDYDLSQVFFITTANNLQAIPLPLQDRMEIITLPGYLETEKQHIAKDYLLPKQIEANGLKPENITVSDKAITEVIRSYTREAGVRNLEREIATICRKTAMQLVEKDDLAANFKVGIGSLARLLGVKKVRHGAREQEPLVGVCNGLAYTGVGGDILTIEVAVMPGKGRLHTTGKLGDVMKESAEAALTYVRSRSDHFDLRPDFHKNIDLHIHVPEGATPKDGPSAGITLATAIVSALLGLPVRNDLAMTGEITLRGRVLPIGGLREKLLAAQRALIKTVIIPLDNEKDLKEVPEAVLKGLDIQLVEHVDEVLPQAILAPKNLFERLSDTAPLCHNLKLTDNGDSPTVHAQ